MNIGALLNWSKDVVTTILWYVFRFISTYVSLEWASACCLTAPQQFFSYIMARTS